MVCLPGKVHCGALVGAFAPLLFPSVLCWIAWGFGNGEGKVCSIHCGFMTAGQAVRCLFPREWCLTRTSKLSTQITSENSGCFWMGDYTPWEDLQDSLGLGLQKKQTKKQKLKIPDSASSRTCPLDECSHTSLLGEEIWIRQQHQPCPFQVQRSPCQGVL